MWDASWAWWCTSVIIGTQEAEAGGLRAQGQPGIPKELKASLGNFVRSSLKKQKESWGACLCEGLGVWLRGRAPA